MREQEIKSDKEPSISDLYAMRDRMAKRVEKDATDWDAKRLIESINDEIRIKRQQIFEREQESLLKQGIKSNI